MATHSTIGQGSQTSGSTTHAGQGIRETAGEFAQNVQKTASETLERAREKGQEMTERAREGFESLRETTSEYLEQGREKAQDLGQTLERQIRSQPMMAILVAAGLGFLVGALWSRR